MRVTRRSRLHRRELALLTLGLAAATCSPERPAPREAGAAKSAGASGAPQVAAANPLDPLVAARVQKIVSEHLDVPPEKVTEKANFIDDLGADSLDIVELVMAFEEEFDVEIPDAKAEHVQTVGDAIGVVQQLTAPKAGGPAAPAPANS